MRKNSVRTAILGTALLAAILTGCGDTVIFEKQADPYTQVHLKNTEIELGTYYVMSGTEFTAVYNPTGSAQASTTAPSTNRVFYMANSEKMVPTMYQGDHIAVQLDNSDIDNLTLERMYDAGYSVGIYGATFTDSAIALNYDTNIGKETDTAKRISNSPSQDIRIVSINDEAVTSDMLDDYGVINCFERNKNYNIGYYSGTVYKTAVLPAVQHTLESWEMITLDDVELTQKGYIAIGLPDDLPSGWYNIPGSGLFKYIAGPRGTADPTIDEMNVDYYSSEDEKRAEYSQQYAINFDHDTQDASVEVVYDTGSITSGSDPAAVLISPDGTEYDLKATDKPDLDTDDYSDSSKQYTGLGYMTVDLDEAMAGKWTLYVEPKTLSIIDTKVLSNRYQTDVQTETQVFVTDSGKKDQRFECDYSILAADQSSDSVTIYGSVIYPDGETHDLTATKDGTNRLIYDAAYLPAGTYTVNVYHYNDTSVDDIVLKDSASTSSNSEVINITG